MGFPRRLEAVWKTEDGKLFETEEEAVRHSTRKEIQKKFDLIYYGLEVKWRAVAAVPREAFFNALWEEGLTFRKPE